MRCLKIVGLLNKDANLMSKVPKRGVLLSETSIFEGLKVWRMSWGFRAWDVGFQLRFRTCHEP